MDGLSQSGKLYLKIKTFPFRGKPPMELKYTLFKILEGNKCSILFNNSIIKSEWIDIVAYKFLPEKIRNNESFAFKIIDYDVIYAIDLYLDVSYCVSLVSNGGFQDLISEDFNFIERIQKTYLDSLSACNTPLISSADKCINLVIDNELCVPNIHVQLRKSQKKSLHWMISMENLGRRYPNPRIDYIPLRGSKYYMKVRDYMTLYDMDYGNESYFRCPGGILANGSGTGKTAICLSLIALNLKCNLEIPMISEREFYIRSDTTLVVVPSEMISHWQLEISKFFGDNLPYAVIDSKYSQCGMTYNHINSLKLVITTYKFLESKFCSNDNCIEIQHMKLSNNINLMEDSVKLNVLWWNRIIFDESHASTSKNEVYEKLRSHFKWIVTSSPDIENDSSYMDSLKMIGVDGMNNPIMCRENFIKNCVWNIKDTGDHNIHDNIVFVKMSESEKSTYNLINSLNNIPKKIIKQMIQLDNIQIGTKKNDINLIEKENSRYISDSIKKIEKQIEHQKKVIASTDNEQCVEIIDRLNSEIVDLKKQSSFFKKSLNEITKVNSVSKKCSICHEIINENIALTKCGHVFCHDCINKSFRISPNCPECRLIINSMSVYYISKSDNVSKFSSRIMELVDFLKKKKERSIVITNSDLSIKVIEKCLDDAGLISLNIKGNILSNKIGEFNKSKETILIIPYYKWDLVASMISCSNIIILHPSYQPEQIDMEKRLISRISTKGSGNTTITRFILNSTLEMNLVKN